MTTASDVRFILETFGMKQATLARAMGVAQATMSRWESGRNMPTGLHDQVLRALHRAAQKVRDSEDHRRRIAGILEMGIGSVVFLQLAQGMP